MFFNAPLFATGIRQNVVYMNAVTAPVKPDFPSASPTGSIFFLFALSLIIGVCASVTTTTRIVLFSVFITDLATGFTSSVASQSLVHCKEVVLGCIPVLPTLLESGIEIRSNDSLIELSPSNVFQAIKRILMRIVLNKAKPARCLVVSVEPHYKTFYLSASGFLSAQFL